MKIHVSELRTGDRLISDVFNSFGLHVLAANTTLYEDDITKLLRHSINTVEIALRKNMQSLQPNEKRNSNLIVMQPVFEGAVHGMKQLFEQVMIEGKIDERIIQHNFDPLIEQFQKEQDLLSLLLTLNSKDDYTYQHCVQVGMISYFIAQWMGLSEEQAHFIGKAGYLHDIGKSKVDLYLLQKPAKLTDKEYEEMKMHTTIGHTIITNSFSDGEKLGLAALQHHERYNGTGYPYKLTYDKLHLTSKIVAVADVYSAMISSRVYQKKRDLLFVLRELHRLSFIELDPQIVQTFVRKMIPNFIGKTLKLTTGEKGHIIMTNPSDVFRPLIRIEDQFIDMTKHSHLEIDTIYLD